MSATKFKAQGACDFWELHIITWWNARDGAASREWRADEVWGNYWTKEKGGREDVRNEGKEKKVKKQGKKYDPQK